MQYDTPPPERDAMKDEERVLRLVRRDGVTYWSGPYDYADECRFPGNEVSGEETRHLSIADAFDAAAPEGGDTVNSVDRRHVEKMTSFFTPEDGEKMYRGLRAHARSTALSMRVASRSAVTELESIDQRLSQVVGGLDQLKRIVDRLDLLVATPDTPATRER
jgi:hypothetical protein|tara:strand:+ start:153 stop:638 length:486 start_codon:yes stop_codon:yes gene_type:complete